MESPTVLNNFQIEELNLISFGKFENRKIDLKSGFNLIHGGNESGKSTIQLFIKAMLYGLPSRKRKDESLKERDRVIPWNGTRAEGIMKINVNGRSLEIHRRFGKTAAGDKTEVCDSISGEVLNEFSDGNIGEALLGIPSGVFEKTLWIRQGGIPIGGNDDELSARLMNIKTGGDETVSVDEALAKLAKEKRMLKAKDGRSAKGRIDELIERRDECKRRKFDLATQLAQTERSRVRLGAAKAESKRTEEEIEKLSDEYKKSIEAEKLSAIRERISGIEDCDKKIASILNNEEYIKAENITEKDIETLFELEKKISFFEAQIPQTIDFSLREEELMKKNSKSSAMVGGGGVLALAGIIIAVVGAILLGNIIPVILGAVALIIGGLVIFSGIRSSAECKNIKSSIDADRQKFQQEEKNRRDAEYAVKDEYRNLLLRLDAKNGAELQKRYTWRMGQTEVVRSLEAMKKGFLGEDTFEKLKEAAEAAVDAQYSAAELEAELTEKRSRQMELVAEIKSLESKMAYEVKIESLPSDIDTEIRAIEDELKEAERRLRVLELAETAVREAGESFRMNFAPALNNKVDGIISKLTCGRYSGVRVAEDYRMRVEAENSLYDAEYFSCGTFEQLYFALRMAAAELICGKAPVFLDDILTAYDNERAVAALEYLRSEGDVRQVVLFTCHSSDRDVAETMGTNIINLN